MLEKTSKSARRSLVVDGFTNSVLDPNEPMLGPVEDGGTIIANTAPGCWGPMITPSLRGGHEVTKPVAVAGAEVGDGIAIRIRDVTVTSNATASGHDSSPEGFCLGDPYVAAQWGLPGLESVAPISVIGTAANLNDAIENGLERAAKLLDMTVPEVRNRATVNGAIEIGRAPGVIQVTFLAPLDRLDGVGLGHYAREQYGL